MTAFGDEWPYIASIIIPVMNRARYTLQCLDAIAEHTSAETPFEVILVDNGSTDETPGLLSSLEGDVQVIRNDVNLGFAAASNQGARAARGKHLVFLNNDTVVTAGWLEQMIALAESDSRIGIVGAKLLYPDGLLAHAGVVIGRGWTVTHLYAGRDLAAHPSVNRVRDFQAVTAACMLLKRDIVDDGRPFDEAFRNGFEDVDLCFRVGESGHRIVYCPTSVVYHHEGISEGRHDHEDANFRLLRRRWHRRRREDAATYLLEDGYFRIGGEDWQWCGFDPEALRTGKGGPAGVSLIVPTRDDYQQLLRCVFALGSYTKTPHEVLVVDAGSRDLTAAFLRIFEGRPGFRVVRMERSTDLLACLRRGVAEAGAQAAIVVTPRVAVTPEWDERLLAHLAPGVGAVGPLMNVAGGAQSARNEVMAGAAATLEELSAGLAAANPGLSRETDLLETEGLLAPRELLAEVLAELPAGALSPGGPGGEISRAILARGHRLLAARDALVHLRETQPAPADALPAAAR